MKFRYLKFKGKIKQVREVEIKSLIDILKLNNTKNQVQDHLNKNGGTKKWKNKKLKQTG